MPTAVEIRPRARVHDLHAVMLTHAQAMNDAVTAVDRMSPTERIKLRADLRRMLAELRPLAGLKPRPSDLTTIHTQDDEGNRRQLKLSKNKTPTVALTIQSARQARWIDPVDGSEHAAETCNWRGKCTKVCVLQHNTGRYPDVIAGRSWRTLALVHHPAEFAALLRLELWRHTEEHGDVLCRPNVNSDAPWHAVPAMWQPTEHGTVSAYGYTKDPSALASDGWLTPTYRVCYSLSERSDLDTVAAFLTRGGTVATVTNRRPHAPAARTAWLAGQAFPVVDGDESDDRFHDPAGHVVDLWAKGYARGKFDRLRGFVRMTY